MQLREKQELKSIAPFEQQERAGFLFFGRDTENIPPRRACQCCHAYSQHTGAVAFLLLDAARTCCKNTTILTRAFT